jgi:hypothetical protein
MYSPIQSNVDRLRVFVLSNLLHATFLKALFRCLVFESSGAQNTVWIFCWIWQINPECHRSGDLMACLCRHREGRRRYSSNPRKRCVVSTTLRPLYPRKLPGTHCTEGWVSPGAGLDYAEDLDPIGIRLPDPPARSKSLYRLSYRRRAECYKR